MIVTCMMRVLLTIGSFSHQPLTGVVLDNLVDHYVVDFSDAKNPRIVNDFSKPIPVLKSDCVERDNLVAPQNADPYEIPNMDLY